MRCNLSAVGILINGFVCLSDSVSVANRTTLKLPFISLDGYFKVNQVFWNFTEVKKKKKSIGIKKNLYREYGIWVQVANSGSVAEGKTCGSTGQQPTKQDSFCMREIDYCEFYSLDMIKWYISFLKLKFKEIPAENLLTWLVNVKFKKITINQKKTQIVLYMFSLELFRPPESKKTIKTI